MKKDMKQAFYDDIGRSHFWTEIAELNACEKFCQDHIDSLDDYMKDVHVDPCLVFAPSSSLIRYEPLGVALIMGSWNFPYFVVIKPLITCIAAGNCAIIKPSELSPNSSNVMQKLFETYLDRSCYKVIQGEAEVSIKLT